VVFQAIDIALRLYARSAGEIDDRIVALGPFSLFLCVPIFGFARVNLDDAQLDETRAGFLAVFRHFTAAAADLAGFVFNFTLERTNHGAQGELVAREIVDFGFYRRFIYVGVDFFSNWRCFCTLGLLRNC